MWVFVRLFRRYRVDILFVSLCILGLVILQRTNSFQGMMINNFLINISSSVNGKTKIVTDYFGLKSKNNALRQRIVELQKNPSSSIQASNLDLASVSYIDLNKKDNYIIINKGSKEGINEETLVITPDNSIIGRVRHTTSSNALVQTVMSRNFNITAKLKDGSMGLTYWDDLKYGYIKMKNIPSYVKIEIGDKVVTSGKGIFPSGITIGTIDKVQTDEATKFYIVDIKLSANFYKLDKVMTLQQNDWKYTDTLLQVRDSLIDESSEL